MGYNGAQRGVLLVMWQAGRVGDSHRGGGEGKVLDGVGGWTAEGPARGTWFKC